MIVVDASAMIEALVGAAPHDDLLDALAGEIHAPHLLDIEVLSGIRGLFLSGRLSPAAAEAARLNHFDFAITRRDTAPLAERIWQLRHHHTSYDASYLALAEAMGAPLYTCDAKLVGRGHAADVRLTSRSD